MLAVALGLLLAAAVAALVWPATYRSTGTILIEQQEVPVDLVRSTISSYADQRIQVISQRVTTTENLMRIIERYGLYADERQSAPREAVIEQMRDGIQFSMISADVVDPRLGRPTKATIAFSVSYDNRSPVLAAKVTNEIVSLYLSENIENRKQRSAETVTFLKEEAERLSTRIVELEASMATFKRQHVNELPEVAQLNLQLLTRTDDELSDVDGRIRSLDQQIVYLDAQLAQINPTSQVFTSTGERVLSPADRLKFLRTEYARVSGVYAADHPDVLRIGREMESLEKSAGDVDSTNELRRQLDDAKAKLKSLREQYHDEHPDVQTMQRLVAAIDQQVAAAEARGDLPPVERPDNPAYIQVKAQREASVNERTALETKRDALRARQSEIEQRITDAPSVEREYVQLVRELENSQLKYREVSQKHMEAQLGQNLEEERKGERFTLIEPPLVPQQPVKPNRIVILAIGLVLAIAGAVGTAALLELLDTRVRGRRDLERLLSVPPLAVLPYIETLAERRARRRYVHFAWMGAVGAVVLAGITTHFMFRPLDVLWAVAVRRLLG